MGLRAQRPERNTGRNKPLADAGNGFNIVQPDRITSRLEIHQITQIDGPLTVNKAGIFLPAFIGSRITGMLHRMDQLTIKGMAFARTAIPEKAADRQKHIHHLECFGMHIGNTRGNACQAKSGNARGHGREILGDKRARQSKGFKIISAAIGGDNRDPHLRHDLQQPVLDGLAIIRHHFKQCLVGQQSPIMPFGNGFFGHIGIDRCCTTADQHAEMMHIKTFARCHIDRRKGTQLLAHKMRMHRAGGQNHRNRCACFRHRPV